MEFSTVRKHIQKQQHMNVSVIMNEFLKKETKDENGAKHFIISAQNMERCLTQWKSSIFDVSIPSIEDMCKQEALHFSNRANIYLGI